ncbi:MAG: hypothetical protein EB127_06590 [Alphaproteobacteria bacterium]|nr:hypothetical protein [Alphaproteobacteria bacterium]
MAYTPNLNVVTASYQANRPTTYDFLRPNAFRFTIKDLPNTSYTCQSANLPALQLGFAIQPTPFLDLAIVGDKMNFGEFSIRFLVTEDMSNYLELYAWIVALGFPKEHSQYSAFVQSKQNRFPFVVNKFGQTDALVYSDGTLTILDSTNNPKTNIIFKELFPISLESLDFEVASQTVQYFTAIATFKFKLFEIEQL